VLADRPKIYGRTAEQTRQEASLGHQTAALMRKAQRTPEQMTDTERAELWQLFAALDELRKSVKLPAPKGGKR
jgi:hypothetical protein